MDLVRNMADARMQTKSCGIIKHLSVKMKRTHGKSSSWFSISMQNAMNLSSRSSWSCNHLAHRSTSKGRKRSDIGTVSEGTVSSRDNVESRTLGDDASDIRLT